MLTYMVLVRRRIKMSFIQSVTGGTFNAGLFLSSADCVRETREIPESMGTTTDKGKYVKAGTVYPSNDSNAVGIVYEDTDVTKGNTAGSVVTKGCVYEDKLPVTDVTYSSVTPTGTENPKEEGWYEKSGNDYILSTDTTVTEGKTYYTATDVTISANAKTALIAKGFTFRTSPTVTR